MAPNTQPALTAIQQAAKANGLAWQPLAAVAHYESGLVPTALGDGGHAFGLFQNNNAGGTITGDPNPRRFFNPNVSATYAARAVKGLNIQGLSPQQQVAAIVNRYERPAKPQPEIAGAQQYLATLGQQGAGQPTPAAPRAALPAALSPQPAMNALSLAPLQAGFALGQQQNQRALDALGKISGRDVLAAPAPDLSALIQQMQAQAPAQTAPPQVAPATRTAVAPTQTNTHAVPGLGGFALPLGGKGFKPLGLPFQGTHSKTMNAHSGSDNWESENAVDLGTPVGTPIYAVADGTIGSQIGSLGSGGRFAGQRVHLVTHGNEVYYAHLSKLAVRAGEQVKKGQLIGYSGEANGVPHLHIALERGNPAKTFDY